MIFLEQQQVWGSKERDHSDLYFIYFHPSVLACLGLFQITKEYFWTVKPLMWDWDGLGWDGWTSNLSADNIYASLKGGSMGSLELADLRNPTQDMQRFLSQWRRWYWLSCMAGYIYVCLCLCMYMEKRYNVGILFHLIFPFFYEGFFTAAGGGDWANGLG